MVQNAGTKGFLVFQPNSRLVIMALAAGGLAIAGIQGYKFLQLQTQARGTTQTNVIHISPVKTVTALGRLEPKSKIIKLSAPTTSQNSRVEKLLVKEGDHLQAGQVVAILDSRDRLQAAWQEAEAAVKVAQISLDKVKLGAKSGDIRSQKAEVARIKAQRLGDEGQEKATIARLEAQWQGEKASQQATIKRIQAELENAQIEFQRYQQLYQQGATSKSLLDTKRLTLDTTTQQLQEAKATLKRIDLTDSKQVSEAKTVFTRINATGYKQISSAQATLNSISEVRPVDVASAKAEVNRTIAAAKQAKANLDQAYVHAPIDSVVLNVITHTGEMVSNDGIVEIGQTKDMYAVAEVYQSDVGKIKPGQKVQISSNSLPSDLQGKVDWVGWKVQRQSIINSDPSENIDSRVVEVHVALDDVSSQKAAKFTNLQVKAVIKL